MRVMVAVLIPAVVLLPAAAVSGQLAERATAPVSVRTIQTPPAPPQLTGTSWHARLLSALGSAALGAGIGYFSSQVFRGDWDEEPGRYEVDRSTWAAVGGGLGFAVGFSFPLGGRGLRPDGTPGLPGGRLRITADEFRDKGMNTADDVVRTLRPEWLIERGVTIFGEAPGEGLLVYLDEVKLGGVRFLRDVSAQIIESVHYFDAGAATYRWGAGHTHGVILIIAAGGRSGR